MDIDCVEFDIKYKDLVTERIYTLGYIIFRSLALSVQCDSFIQRVTGVWVDPASQS